ncbi:hypothetical protein DRN86_02205 [Candidatus Geothermarchaeota archaeon]|mgnify:CR=1 FL=1|nr:MAG: hypothetical protein DRN86_02205 [Candidatus Geothermarchaeota archaeon]
MEAIISIIADPEKLSEMCKRLSEIEEVKKVYEITGEYDVLVEMEATLIEEFKKVLKDKILEIEE